MAKALLGKLKQRIRQVIPRMPSQTVPPSAPLEHVVIGVGAQKSGTSWLASSLSRHPDILMRKKEVHYWDTVRAPYRQFDSLLGRIIVDDGNTPGSPFGAHPMDHSQYLPSLELTRTTERIVSEISPSYALCSRSTFAAINAVHHDVRFIFLMRDPVKRLWSGLRHKMRAPLQMTGSNDWLEEMFLQACEDSHDPDFRRSQYHETLRDLDAAGCNVCVMFYETLFTDESLRTIADFVGVDNLTGQFDARINAGVATELRLSEPARRYGQKALADTYGFILDRFGDLVPEQWSN